MSSLYNRFVETRVLTEAVARQYERHPYPGRSLFALPLRSQAHTLAWEWGQFLRTGRYLPHSAATRILVAGSGDFEPLVVARAHPLATVTAVDLSSRSLARLRFRARLAGVSSRLETIQADLHEDLKDRLGSFDFIVCTGVLHHSPHPEKILGSLRGLLRPEGLLRVMFYAERSRLWIYALKSFFDGHGLAATTPHLRTRVRKLIETLPPLSPLRTSFECYSDAQIRAGLIDGFFHAYENPFSPLQFAAWARAQNLKLAGFGHAWHSQPRAYVRAGLSEIEKLSPWEQLQVLDDLGELSTNPVLWLSPTLENVGVDRPARMRLNPVLAGMRGEFVAPLLEPLSSDEATTHLRLSEVDFTNPERFLEGGILIGEDGVLPPSLACVREKEDQIAGQITVPRPIPPPRSIEEAFALQAQGVSSAIARLGGNELRSRLKQFLEPRIDFNGRELPGLSFRDSL